MDHCPTCAFRKMAAVLNQAHRDQEADDIVRLLWSVSLCLFAFAVTFATGQ